MKHLLNKELFKKGTGQLLKAKQEGDKAGSLYKRALLCYEGDFESANGSVKVTKQILEKVATRYNSEHEQTANEDDYSPILVDHNWKADLVKGRIMADLAVESFTHPSDNSTRFGLFGTLRFDDEDAIKKVESGKYAHLSIGFDDETGQLDEVSVVAVEAAKRSIILGSEKSKTLQGEKPMNFEAKFKATLAKNKSQNAVRLAAVSSLKSQVALAKKEVTTLGASLAAAALGLKKKAVLASFRTHLLSGKMTKAEFDGIETSIDKYVAYPQEALTTILSSYEARAVSNDSFQFGKEGVTPKKITLSAEQLRAAQKAQLEGKEVETSASQDDDEDKEGSGGENKGEKSALSLTDVEAALAEIDKLKTTIETILASIKATEEEATKLEGEKADEEDSEAK